MSQERCPIITKRLSFSTVIQSPVILLSADVTQRNAWHCFLAQPHYFGVVWQAMGDVSLVRRL